MTSVAPGCTTASFSPAMSRTVGPSQRVCSSPTFVSTTTGGAEHVGRVVAAAEAGLDHRDLDLAARQLVERGGGHELELRHAVALLERAVDLRGRRGGALHGGAERVAVQVLVADPDPLGEARQVRREERARRARRAPPAARPPCAPSRTCRWSPRRGSPRSAPAGCRARSAAAACARARTASRTARARAGAPRRPRDANRSKLLQLPLEPVELLALGVHDGGRRLGDEALVGELALGARDLLLERRRGARARARRRPRGRRVSDSSTATLPPGTPTVAIGSPPSADHSTRASRATCAAVRS